MSKITLRALMCFISLSITFLSCSKPDDSPQDARKYHLTKIINHHITRDSFTSNQYTLSYSVDEITGLTGNSGDTYTFTKSPLWNGTSLFLSTHNTDTNAVADSLFYSTNTLDQTYWVKDTLPQYQYIGSTASLNKAGTQQTITKWYGGKPYLREVYGLNSESDPTNYKVYNSKGELMVSIEVSYSDKQTNWDVISPFMNHIDPFPKLHNMLSPTESEIIGSGYPVNLFYGAKCPETITMKTNNGSVFPYPITYEYNSGGLITKISISGVPFMSYEYAEK